MDARSPQTGRITLTPPAPLPAFIRLTDQAETPIRLYHNSNITVVIGNGRGGVPWRRF